MSYIVRASWWQSDVPDAIASALVHAVTFATGEVCIGERNRMTGTVTITKDGEVIREYKVGEFQPAGCNEEQE